MEKKFTQRTGLSERLNALRRSKSLSCQQLADLAGCSKGYISSIERNKKIPSKQMLKAIAEALSTTLEFLVTGTDSRPSAISDLIRLIKACNQPSIIGVFKDLITRLFLFELNRQTHALDRKELLLKNYAENLQKGETPPEIEHELEMLNKTIEEINNRTNALLPIIRH